MLIIAKEHLMRVCYCCDNPNLKGTKAVTKELTTTAQAANTGAHKAPLAEGLSHTCICNIAVTTALNTYHLHLGAGLLCRPSVKDSRAQHTCQPAKSCLHSGADRHSRLPTANISNHVNPTLMTTATLLARFYF
jgi:hypothetical protein